MGGQKLTKEIPPLGDGRTVVPAYDGTMNDERPCLYQILLRGKLDCEQASWFPELAAEENDDNNTLLAGELPDQSALLGILFRAHNLNLQILFVNVKAV